MSDPHREERSDRGVRPHRHLRVRPEHGEENRAGDERVEGGDRRHAGKPGGSKLFRHDDGEKRHRGERVGTGKRRLVAAQRLKERTGQVPVCLSLLPGRRARNPSPCHRIIMTETTAVAQACIGQGGLRAWLGVLIQPARSRSRTDRHVTPPSSFWNSLTSTRTTS